MQTFDQHANIFIKLFDALAILASGSFVYWLRFRSWHVDDDYKNLIALGLLTVILILSQQRIYQSWRGQFGFQLLTKLSYSWVLSGALLMAFILFSHQGENYSRLWIGGWWLLSLLLSIVTRVIVYTVLGYRRSTGKNVKYIFTIGDQSKTAGISKKLANYSWAGLKIRDCLDISKAMSLETSMLLDKIKGTHEIWITTSLKDSEQLHSLYLKLQNCTQNIRYVPDIQDLRLINNKVSDIAGIQTIDLSTSPLDGSAGVIKRLEDIILGSLIFFCSLPILLVIGIAVKLTSKGPIIFKQARHGIDGKPIKIYKFRSMYIHKEKGSDITQATKNDCRLTPIGAFLRKTSLDELPQFYNVLQGRMSIVGPRPHAIQHNEYYANLVESYMKRHKVKPGITGWAQVKGYRGETDTLDKMEHRVEHDLFYIDNWSLILDLKIITLTALAVIRDDNAY